MKTLYAVLVAGIVGFGGVVTADEKAAPKIEGTYTIVGGVKDGVKAKVDQDGKPTVVTIDAKQVFLGEKGKGFVIAYKLVGTDSPTKMEMKILDAPPPFADAKGAQAYGLIAAKGDTLKLAYSLDKEKQPTDFSGKHGFAFELKKSAK
ncbi:hypothetical protein [Urbifossiella limnaea]|uniref:Uncharacterized protein n=1 Tax=Urbifossiella limnaea TaxID=2528023 RepID=A0A517XY43_9BACT|nr:hypothetical protein [Urbifossiella limnaea]QDU22436.1 hypothetical protein ETAA1_44160 [Urbifossiella limnaea]